MGLKNLLEQFIQEIDRLCDYNEQKQLLRQKLLDYDPSLPSDEEIEIYAICMNKKWFGTIKSTVIAVIVSDTIEWIKTLRPVVDWEKFEYEFYGFMAYRRDNNIETSDQDIVKWVKSKLK
jgi:hypothetical protein